VDRKIAIGAFAIVAAGLVGLWAATEPAVLRFLGLGDPSDCAGGAVAGGQIGGPFTLVDQTGRTVTDAEVLAQPSLVYFGYTFCPDVCPTDVARNADAVDLLAERGYQVQPVFISVDPKRDTPEALADFASVMHPRMVALSGTDDQVAQAVAAWRAYRNVHDDGSEWYLVDHSTFTYLMLPGTGFADFFRREASAEDIAARTACFLDSR
jgi:protein SCO1/2